MRLRFGCLFSCPVVVVLDTLIEKSNPPLFCSSLEETGHRDPFLG